MNVYAESIRAVSIEKYATRELFCLDEKEYQKGSTGDKRLDLFEVFTQSELQSWPKIMWTVAFDQLFKQKCKICRSFFNPRPPLTMLCSNMLCKQVKIKIIPSTLFGGSGSAIYV